MSTQEHNEINAQLKKILARSDNVGWFRRLLIGIFFPEVVFMCGDLSGLCRMLKSP